MRRRIYAALIHLAISVLVAAVLALVFYFVIYPYPLFRAVGGTSIFMLLMAVDIILGPLLTFIVYNEQKKSLRQDLTVIVAIQIAAMAYGVLTLYQGRPVYVASLGHRFDLITAPDVPPVELLTAKQTLPKFGPKWVGTRIPNDTKESERVLQTALAGIDYGHYPQHHAELDELASEMLKHSQPATELDRFQPGETESIRAWFSANQIEFTTARYLGLKAPSEDMAVIIDGKTGKVLKVAPFKPWD